jgi:hypothetical protein
MIVPAMTMMKSTIGCSSPVLMQSTMDTLFSDREWIPLPQNGSLILPAWRYDKSRQQTTTDLHSYG